MWSIAPKCRIVFVRILEIILAFVKIKLTVYINDNLMRNLLFVLLFTSVLSFSQNRNWGKVREAQHLLNRQDSITWDYNLLNQDIKNNTINNNQPINNGVFPVPHYDLIGENTFVGVACGNDSIPFNKKGYHLMYSYLGVVNNEMIKEYVGNKSDETFFILVVLTDAEIVSDADFFDKVDTYVTSRNNPDYIGQGFIKTKKTKIDFVAFLTANRDEYAIVNMRLFNLKYGRIVLIAPQKDTTLRSMQIKTNGVISTDELDNYLPELIKRRDVQDFFMNDNNI